MSGDIIPTFYGPKSVAQWCGVPVATFSNWLRRFDDFPAPAGRSCGGPERTHFFWREDQQDDWLLWARGKGFWCPGAAGISGGRAIG